jgi:hypothetical protein
MRLPELLSGHAFACRCCIRTHVTEHVLEVVVMSSSPSIEDPESVDRQARMLGLFSKQGGRRASTSLHEKHVTSSDRDLPSR